MRTAPNSPPSASAPVSTLSSGVLLKEALAASPTARSVRLAAREGVTTTTNPGTGTGTGAAGRALMAESFLPPVTTAELFRPATPTTAPVRAATAGAARPSSTVRLQSPLRKERLPGLAPTSR